MAETLTIDFSRPMALFPLAGCVLLPHATVPLHIFEPRYRAMTHDALDAAGLIAMATIQGQARGANGGVNPPLKPYVCIGYMLRHERLHDGRYNLLLQGVCRARIREELSHEPYRVALFEPAEVRPVMEIDLEDQRRRLEGLLDDPLLGRLAAVNAIKNWMTREVPTNVLIDLSILALAGTSGDRYEMLAQPSAAQRAQWLEHHLEGTRRTLRIANRIGPSRTDDGMNLN